MKEITTNILENLDIDKIFLDIDGCIFHSVEAMCKILNKKFNMNVQPQQITSWNFECCYPKMSNEEIEWLFANDKFFDYVRLIDGSKEFMLKHKDNLILITKGNEKNIFQKRQWLDLNGLEEINMIGLPLDVSKDIINMKDGLFIDDTTKNLNEVTTSKYKVQFKEYDNETEWSSGWEGMVLRKWI